MVPLRPRRRGPGAAGVAQSSARNNPQEWKPYEGDLSFTRVAFRCGNNPQCRGLSERSRSY